MCCIDNGACEWLEGFVKIDDATWCITTSTDAVNYYCQGGGNDSCHPGSGPKQWIDPPQGDEDDPCATDGFCPAECQSCA
jgi:hypothetical protein